LILVDMYRMIGLFMDYCHSKQLRPRTLLSYEQALKLFAVWLKESEGVQDVERVREGHIRRYIMELQSRGKYTACIDQRMTRINHPTNRRDYKEKVSSCTINNYLRVFFTWLEETECIVQSPMKKVRALPQARSPRDFMTDDEVKRLIKSLDKSVFNEYRDLPVALLMLDCGMRLGETLSIEMQQVNMTERSILLPADKTKGRKERQVYFAQKTAMELRRWMQYKDRYCDSDSLFPVKHTGFPLKVSNYEANFRKYLQRINLDKHISPHNLRNNFAKRCLMSGMDIYTLSRILGHSSVKVTEQAYLDLTDADIRRQYARFSPVDSIFK